MVKVPLSYPIGTPGTPWSPNERTAWLSTRQIHRSFQTDVVSPLEQFCNDSSLFRLVQYGSISSSCGDEKDDGGELTQDLPLYAVLPKIIYSHKPSVLITGGTHGYETSGIMGALSFLTNQASSYLSNYNVIVIPCLCPWGYERIERWVSSALDPNRSFIRTKNDDYDNTSIEWRTEEASQLMTFLDGLHSTQDETPIVHWKCHLDLHETTQSDCTEFRPAKAARDGLTEYDNHIPDGFYLVGSSTSRSSDDQCLKWYNSILSRVEKVTHIAEMETDNTLSGYPATSRGLIVVPGKDLGLCGGGCVDAEYVVTTEVYPDSVGMSEEGCVRAQVEAVCAAMDFLMDDGD